jgi:hypothetical protein
MTAGRCPLTLIGEEIAGSWNEEALADIALVFGGRYLAYNSSLAPVHSYRDRVYSSPLALDTHEGCPYELCPQINGEADNEEIGNGGEDDLLPILGRYDCLMAAENLPGAQSVYSFRPPREGAKALLVGSEARGLRRRTRKQAHAIIEIPLISRNINCLNVAAAAAVMLYYLSQDLPMPTKQRSLASLQKSRPDLLLIGGCDPMELGSTIRSACAFGWERVFLDDRGDAWYECDRRIKSEGRGTARRGRNPIKVLPHREAYLADYRKMVVCTTHPCGRTPPQLPLIGKDLLLVLEDERSASTPWSPPAGWHGEVTYAALPQQPSPDRYHYRQMSAIALAEVARQLGEPISEGLYLRSRKDRYRREMEREETCIRFDLEDLLIF